MAEINRAHLSAGARTFCTRVLLALILLTANCFAQPSKESPYFARVDTFGILAGYSGDSSHILLGDAENRMLLQIGASYNRRLMLNRRVNWQYSGELLPVALESDPTGVFVQHQTAPTPATFSYDAGPLVSCAPDSESYSYVDPATGVTYSGTTSISCNGRRWVVGEAMSPVGMQWNFMPMRKIQLLVDGHGGYMYSSQAIPIDNAGSFNFTFDIGAGFEVFRSKTKSIRAEYRYHHISNHGTADLNPGIDNGLFQVTYAFGH